MKALISNYNNVPGKHCGSTAMRNLIAYYCDLELSEAEVIGLGSACDFIYLKSPQSEPPVLTLGRSRSMEIDLAHALGIDYREMPDFDNAHAWESVRQEVIEGRPTMLSGDTYYLDYRGFGGHHFPSHRFVLLGFDDDREIAMVADRIESAVEECSYSALAASRNPPIPISTYNLWGKFYDTEVKRSLPEAYALAIKRSVERMLGIDSSPEKLLRAFTGNYDVEIATGIKGLAAFYHDFPGWQNVEQWQIIVRYTSNCFENYGTGGGNFRQMYTSFLESAQRYLPEVVGQSSIDACSMVASQWRELSASLYALTKNESRQGWQDCHQQIGQILEQETRLYQHLKQQLEAV
jgi:hypothetical protein